MHMFKDAGSLEVAVVEQTHVSADSGKDDKAGPAGGPVLQAADVTDVTLVSWILDDGMQHEIT